MSFKSTRAHTHELALLINFVAHRKSGVRQIEDIQVYGIVKVILRLIQCKQREPFHIIQWNKHKSFNCKHLYSKH